MLGKGFLFARVAASPQYVLIQCDCTVCTNDWADDVDGAMLGKRLFYILVLHTSRTERDTMHESL